MKVQTIENIDYFGEDAVFTVEKKQLTIYEITRTAIAKDIKRGKVECDGFKNPATLDFDNAENERITEIK